MNDNVYNAMVRKGAKAEKIPEYNTSIRDWLIKQGITNFNWDEDTKTFLIDNKPFFKLGDEGFDIINGKAMSNEEILKQKLQSLLAQGTATGEISVQPVAPTTPTATTTPAEQPKKAGVRDWLISMGISNEDIGWDNKTKTVTVKGQPFLVNPENVKGTTYSDTTTLKNSFQKLVASGLAKQHYTNSLINPDKTETDANGNINAVGYLNQLGIDAVQSEDGIYVGNKKILDTPFASEQDIINAYQTATGDVLPQNIYDIQDKIAKGKLEGQKNAIDKYIDNIINGMENPESSPMGKYITNYWDNAIKSANDKLQITYNEQLTALQNKEAKVKANYAGQEWEIQHAIMTSRARTGANMAARGMLLSSVMSNALAGIEVWGLQQVYKTEAQKTADLNGIAADIATLTSNFALRKDEIYNQMLVEKGAQMLSVMEKDQDRLHELQQIQMQIDAELAGLEGTEAYQRAYNDFKAESDRIKAEQDEEDRMFKKWQIQDESDQNWARVNLSVDELDENSRQFDETLGFKNLQEANSVEEYNATMAFNREQFDWQKTKDQAYIDIAQYNAAKGSNEKINPDIVYSGNEADIAAEMHKLDGFAESKVLTPEEYAKYKYGEKYTPAQLSDAASLSEKDRTVQVLPESIKKIKALGETILAVYSFGKSLSTNNIYEFQTNFQNLLQVTNQDQIEEVIDKIGNPVAQTLAVLFSQTSGDIVGYLNSMHDVKDSTGKITQLTGEEIMKSVCEDRGVSYEIFQQYVNYFLPLGNR